MGSPAHRSTVSISKYEISIAILHHNERERTSDDVVESTDFSVGYFAARRKSAQSRQALYNAIGELVPFKFLREVRRMVCSFEGMEQTRMILLNCSGSMYPS